jgi:hypothetical protein
MHGEEEVSIATNAMELKTKNSKQFRINVGESDYVSSAHISHLDKMKNIREEFDQNPKITEGQEDTDLDIFTMHANQNNSLPKGSNAKIVKSFIDIARTTGQTSKIMNFPPIDHDSTIW